MSSENSNQLNSNPFLGKKVFFLYPHSVLQKEILSILVANEYEVYLINDHKKLVKIIEYFPNSIAFINIDEVLSVDAWGDYIKIIMNNEKTKTTQTGVVTYNTNRELAKKFLMELMIPCGFIILNLGIDKSLPILLKMLTANEAKGRRKHIRAIASEHENTKFNVNINKTVLAGRILDISIAGMAVRLDSDVELTPKVEIQDIQVILKGIICRVSGTVAGARQDDKRCYIFLFTQVDDKAKVKIHSYIHKRLHDIMDDLLKKL
ncbi:MAG: PilZ domain-containing protein [Spirochaetaceae bacterium]|nr:PilZ domain-containing protein [Spirochaetaceae bacterium]